MWKNKTSEYATAWVVPWRQIDRQVARHPQDRGEDTAIVAMIVGVVDHVPGQMPVDLLKVVMQLSTAPAQGGQPPAQTKTAIDKSHGPPGQSKAPRKRPGKMALVMS